MAKQKDYFSFVEDLSQGHGTIRKDFASLMSKCDLTEKDLSDFFKKKGYGEITNEDCAKILAALRAMCKALIVGSVLYY